jgi:predicted alpha-1,2-mannosidase
MRTSPGFYRVKLATGVGVELTASARVGVHRYSFPAGAPAHVLLDLRHTIYDYPGKVLWSQLRIRADGTVTGMRETRGWAPGRKLYFALRFSAPVSGHALYDREPVEAPYKGFAGPGTSARDIPFIQGRGLVGVFDFGALAAPLTVKVALSPASEQAAVSNMDEEVAQFDFDEARARAQVAWTTELSRVRMEAPAPLRRSLYTALYHALMAPSIAGDADRNHRGPDDAVHQSNGFDFVSSFSLWDTYRAEQPLMTLIQPASRTAAVMNSLIDSQRESPYGILPVWQFAGLETWCMIGYHAVPELADAIVKGLDAQSPNAPGAGFDADAALDAMIASADYRPYGRLGDYIDHGYVAIDADGEAVSKTLEYAFDDWSIARAARKLGRSNVAERFEHRAANWRNVFDPATGWARPKLASGAWREPFDPARAGEASGFTEGNSWQYTEYAPQDIGGLIRGLGGDDKLIAKLDATFDAKVDPKTYGNVEDMAGLIGQYVHGNEPSHHMAYLYAYAGAPWRTQARLKQIVDSQYRPAPDGLVGNDDLGQMSAYVARVALNGRALSTAFITHDQILAGGELRFTMAVDPDTRVTPPSKRPYSMTPYR